MITYGTENNFKDNVKSTSLWVKHQLLEDPRN